MIPFNKPYITGNELKYMENVVLSHAWSGDGGYTRKCQEFFESNFGFQKTILTTSCTDALEMAALLIEIKPGDEVIVPSFTYVSTANVFEKFGAKIIFADCKSDFPMLDEESIESLITFKTKAIVPVHYAGVSCNMERIMEIALKHNIYVIEDAAMAIDSQFVPARNESKFLGGIGHFSAFSFHETKNISCGEGGLLVINDGRFIERAEIIRDKGTNKNCFLKGDAEKYEWVDVGGSFSPNEMTAAFLFAQLEKMEFIQKKRMEVWNEYYKQLSKLKSSLFELPILPEFGQSNGNTFYILCDNKAKRDELIEFMKVKGVKLAFHYNCLHKTKYYAKKNEFLSLPNAEKFSDCLVRLPMYTELKAEEISFVVSGIKEFFGN